MPKGRGAKRGELRGAARAGQGRACGAGGVTSSDPRPGHTPSASHIGACGGPLTHAMTWAGCGVVLTDGSRPRAPRIQSMWRLTSVRLVRDTSVDHSGRLAGRVGCPCGCAARGIQALLFSAPSPCWPLPFTSLPWQHRADHLHRPSPTRC